MNNTQLAQAITLRLPPDLHAAVTQAARSRSQSVNAYIQHGLEELVRVEEEKARYAAYTLLGQDVEECDVEYAIHAQAEVMLHDNS